MAKTIIVSNRLPIKISNKDGELVYQPSEGGLATGLGSIYKEGNNIWIGWPGIYSISSDQEKTVIDNLQQENMYPVFLTEEEITGYYEGFSNETLWPLFHYFTQFAQYDHSLWEHYVNANKKFAETIVHLSEEGDTIWVHDYQLMLVPEFVRAQKPNVSIGYFQHIPFPSFEVFRFLPWRKELLSGLLGADLIGFHTYDDTRHFLSAVGRLLGISNYHGAVQKDDRIVEVDLFPMGIDYDKYASIAAEPNTLQKESEYRNAMGSVKSILSIDRLDYSKGIPKRLFAFDRFLQKHPQYIGMVSLIMIVVPSRDNVEKYKELKIEVDEMVGRINANFRTMDWNPIHYFYRSFPINDLSAFYRMADVALVTPMRDGMNLVCKEYIASKLNQEGVLILSEMAGASKELSDAILINPNDIEALSDAIYRALEMPLSEQIMHMEIMQTSLKRYNIHHWVDLFMEHLAAVKSKQKQMKTRPLGKNDQDILLAKYKTASKRLLFLDYDGTLTSFHADPLSAQPDQELLSLLQKISADPINKVIIISGRQHSTLESWLGQFPIDMVAEHGVWLKKDNQAWGKMQDLDNGWKKNIKPVMEWYVGRTPGSFIEEKDYSLVWHYRKVETGLGELRTRELISHIRYMTTNLQLQILEGDMVVELKSIFVNKGLAAAKWLEEAPSSDFILSIGDDWTDEDTFKAMPEGAYTIKVGHKSSEAKYRLNNVAEVRHLLKQLASNS